LAAQPCLESITWDQLPGINYLGSNYLGSKLCAQARDPCARPRWWTASPPSGLAAVLFQARHDLHEIAGAMAGAQPPLENVLPRVLARAGGTGQAKDVGAAREPRAGARLDGRCPHLVE